MLAAAFFSAAIAAMTGSVWIGLLAGIGASMALSIVHGLASITFRGNQLISGVAINFLAAGLTVLIAQDWFQQGGRTPSLTGNARFNEITLPFADALARCALAWSDLFRPDLGSFDPGLCRFPDRAADLVPAVSHPFWPAPSRRRRKPGGRRHRRHLGRSACAMRPLRSAALLCGIAGAYLATGLQAGFVKDMSSGRGFIALAALIFAKWRPWYALCACLLFGFLQALSLRPDAVECVGADQSPWTTSGRAALYPDRRHPGRFRRQGDPAARGRRALRQGTLDLAFIGPKYAGVRGRAPAKPLAP